MKKITAQPAVLLTALVVTCQGYLWGVLHNRPRRRIGMIRRMSWRLGPAMANADGKPSGNPWGRPFGDPDAMAADGERGDVPGWVMITLMSAILVAGLLAIALPALKEMFTQAMEQVKPQ